MSDRRVVTWVSVTMDGYTSGAGGPQHDTWLYEHAMQEQTAAYFETVCAGTTRTAPG
jgi:hypothetical protein